MFEANSTWLICLPEAALHPTISTTPTALRDVGKGRRVSGENPTRVFLMDRTSFQVTANDENLVQMLCCINRYSCADGGQENFAKHGAGCFLCCVRFSNL